MIFPGQAIMAQSGNGAACDRDVTSLGTGKELNFDDDTMKGKDSTTVNSVTPKGLPHSKTFNIRKCKVKE